MKSDWYTQKVWDDKYANNFFLKLSRVKNNWTKAQYTIIQGGELAYTKDENLMQVAEDLLNNVLIEYPDYRIGKSNTLKLLGDIYQFRSDNQMALNYYKQAIDFEAIFPNSISNAFMDYAELAVKTNRTDLYEDVEKIIFEERYNYMFFPSTRYLKYSILSIISKQRGDMEKAKHYADLAEQNVAAKESGFNNHKTLGLVRERDEHLDKMMYE